MKSDASHDVASRLDASLQMASADHNTRVMQDLAIEAAGRYFYYDGYRYERLHDAVAYAELTRARGLQRTNWARISHTEDVDAPTAYDKEIMEALSIEFLDGRFIFRGHHYDRLIDAINYARLRRESRPHSS